MKKIATLVLLISLFASCNDKNCGCEKIIEGGMDEEFYILKQKNVYYNCNDTTNFIHHAYFPNNSLAHTVRVRNNEFDGLYQSFDSLGNPEREGIYKKGKRNGTWKLWKSNSYMEKEFVKDIKYGKTYEIHDRITEVFGQYENDLEEGMWIWKRKNRIQAVAFYKNGKYNGIVYSLYPNGQLMYRVEYLEDSIISEKEYWDEHGAKISEQKFNDMRIK